MQMASDLDLKFPEIDIDVAYKDKYEYLIKTDASPFFRRTMADVFIFAMALAIKKDLPPKKLTKRTKLPSNAFDSEKRTLMRSVLIHQKDDVYAIRDNTMVKHLCEDYANAGIEMLHMKIEGKPDSMTGQDVLVKLIQS